MPQNARIFIVEDDPIWSNLYKALFEDTGHTIVFLATTMVEAKEALPKLSEMDIHVAIIDGNISPDGHNGTEGKYLVNEIKRLFPDVKTIGMSGMFPLGADVDLGKQNSTQLISVIDDI